MAITTTVQLLLEVTAMYSYGNYYTWHAAIADTTYNGTNNKSSDTTSICPSGWRMPTGGASGEYLAVYNEYSGTSGTGEGSIYAKFRKALSLPLSSYFDSGSADDQGSGGYFWSSTYSNGRNMYDLNVDASDVYLQGFDDRTYGNSVRCIAQ